jgi:hypothetical protein
MKVKQLLYGMMYGLLIFFTASCSEENSENLPDNVAIYQSYLVAFSDSQPTLAYARFSPEKDVPLKEIKLTGGASIMANGKEMEYHYFDGNTIFGYSYSLSLGKDEQVSFVFQRKRQQETRMLTNYAYKEWINEIHIPSELTTIANQEIVVSLPALRSPSHKVNFTFPAFIWSKDRRTVLSITSITPSVQICRTRKLPPCTFRRGTFLPLFCKRTRPRIIFCLFYLMHL